MAANIETQQPKNDTQQNTRGLNNLCIGVHKVFSSAEQEDYLKKRFDLWNISSPEEFRPATRDLPPVYKEENLSLDQNAKISSRVVDAFRVCAKGVMDYYFPLIGNEVVAEDILAFTSEPYHAFPTGTAVVIRRTNKAEFFYIDPSVHVDSNGTSVVNIQAISYQQKPILYKDGSGSNGNIVTTILGDLTELLPGPFGPLVKIGVELIDFALGEAGDSGPSWTDIKNLMRQVIREELITNDLEYIQGDYEEVKRWIDVTYSPNKKRLPKAELWNMLRPYIDLVLHDISLLIQHNHRLPGFGLLLLGVGIYLGLLQEQISLGYQADIRKAAGQWATDMLAVWEEVKTDRHAQIVVTKYSYSVYVPTGDVITCYYWNWLDKKTNESRGDRSGPWQAGGKDDHSEADCRNDAERHFQAEVLPLMSSSFANPDATAEAWKKVCIPE